MVGAGEFHIGKRNAGPAGEIDRPPAREFSSIGYDRPSVAMDCRALFAERFFPAPGRWTMPTSSTVCDGGSTCQIPLGPWDVQINQTVAAKQVEHVVRKKPTPVVALVLARAIKIQRDVDLGLFGLAGNFPKVRSIRLSRAARPWPFDD